jgi:hypothetical protein
VVVVAEQHLCWPTPIGSVVVDIGESTGALLVDAPSQREGAEIEIRRCGTQWTGTHVAVRERHVSNRVFFAGLFSALESGVYEIRWRDDDKGIRKVLHIAPASVTETSLPR